MGGGKSIASDNPLIGGSVRESSVSISYWDEKSSPTYCYRLWAFDYRKTDLF